MTTMTPPSPVSRNNGIGMIPGPALAILAFVLLAVTSAPAAAGGASECVGTTSAGGIVNFRNNCDRAIYMLYCIVDPTHYVAEVRSCDSGFKGPARMDPGGESTFITREALGSSTIQLFACYLPKLPDWEPGAEQGYCRSAEESAQARRKALGTPAERRRIQQALAAQGMNPGPADGVFGPRTQKAVRAWQRSKGYAATGELTAAQVQELLGARARMAPKAETERTSQVEGGDLWGSIAFSQESGGGYAWAIVWNSGGREAAARQALEVCRREGGGSCHEAGWFRNACGALALGDGNGYGVDGGATTGEAERAALAACREVNRNCRMEVSRCSTQGLETAGVVEPPEPVGPVKGERFRDCDGCPLMVVVPAGRFMMGSPSGEQYRHDREGPVHRVTIAEPIAVGVYEVTFGEWDACVSGGGCSGYRPDDSYMGRGNRPVINVNWEDAQSYVGWLSRKTGRGYRLLSESEWEYVARAGTETAYHYGSGISPSQANYNGPQTVPVGSYSSNAFGLHDVHGNVWEWVEDCWNDSYRGAPSDGSAWESGDCSGRVLRGGSWSDEPRYLRSANRGGSVTGDRYNGLGFRVARTLD